MNSESYKKPMLNPDDFVITRKRKKYRFAQFHNSPNCFELDEWQTFQGTSLDTRGDGDDIVVKKYDETSPLVIEVGAGTAIFLVELAANNPEKTYVAIDVKADRLQKGAREAIDRGIKNIYFVRARADQVGEVAGVNSVSEIWLTFSDPFPKKRDANRRLGASRFLKIYKNILLDNNAYLRIKTDDHAFFDWTLEQLVGDGWNIGELSFDLHDSSLPEEYKIMTTYEERWVGEGRTILFASAKAN